MLTTKDSKQVLGGVIGVFICLAVLLVGLMLEMWSLGSGAQDQMNAPKWFAPIPGLIFILPGAFLLPVAIGLIVSTEDKVQPWALPLVAFMAALELSCFAIIGWVAALGSKPGSVIGPLGIQTAGRIIFGVVAALISLLSLAFWLALVAALVVRVGKCFGAFKTFRHRGQDNVL
jgi:hypothetical protein